MAPKLRVTLSRHARIRILQRGFSEADVLDILRRGDHGIADDGLRQAIAKLRGREASVVYENQKGGPFVLTVMWVD